MNESKPTPIAYSLQGAAEAIGQSVSTIKDEIRKGNLIPRYPNSKPIILHDDLEEWARTRSVDRPS